MIGKVSGKAARHDVGYFEEIHGVGREIARHFQLQRFPHVGLRNGQTGEELVVPEHLHVPRYEVT